MLRAGYPTLLKQAQDHHVTTLDRVKRIWYLSPMRAAKVQASLRIRAVSPEPSLLAHTSSVSRGTFRQKARPLAPLNGWACAVKICHDGMLEDTNSLDGDHTNNCPWSSTHILCVPIHMNRPAWKGYLSHKQTTRAHQSLESFR